MAQDLVPTKPGTFKCPESFESTCLINEDFLQSDDDDDVELVLIQAPYDINFSLLNEKSFTLNGNEDLLVQTEKGAETLRLSSKEVQANSELGNFNVLVGDKGKYGAIAKKFTHHMEISKLVNVPGITFPPKTDKSHKMPSDLKQRYQSFGSGDPVVTVGEKHMLKYKSKHKLKPLDISKTRKSSREALEKKKKFVDKMELTSRYVEQLSLVLPQEDTLQKKDKKKEPKLKSKQSHDEIDLAITEFKSPKNSDKKAKKSKTPKKLSSDHETDKECSREDLIKLIMGEEIPKKRRSAKSKDTSMLNL